MENGTSEAQQIPEEPKSTKPAPSSAEAKNVEGRFKYSDIHRYLECKTFPEGFTKLDKNALRKRSKFFVAQGPDLYYVGGSTSKCELITDYNCNQSSICVMLLLLRK